MQVGDADAARTFMAQGCLFHLIMTNCMHAVDELKDVAKSLRRLPVVEPELPTVSAFEGRGSCTSSMRPTGGHSTLSILISTQSLAHWQVALVGAPNVGKSSLVQLLSSGLPEVQNYPFTTRSIKMGHFYVDSRRHQVTGELLGARDSRWQQHDATRHEPSSAPPVCLQTRLAC